MWLPDQCSRFSSSIQEERNNLFGNSKKAARELFSSWANDNGAKFQGLIIPNEIVPRPPKELFLSVTL